jgi:hypothetical protein
MDKSGYKAGDWYSKACMILRCLLRSQALGDGGFPPRKIRDLAAKPKLDGEIGLALPLVKFTISP